MLYTSYLSKLNKLPKDALKILITRYPPKGLKLQKTNDDDIFLVANAENTWLDKKLSPSGEVLIRYKKDGDWDSYCKAFYEEMKKPDMAAELNRLLVKLKLGNDIFLICVEKDFKRCHRFLLAQWFERMGIRWMEWDENNKGKEK